MRKLVLATTNKGKVAELKELLADLPVTVIGLDQYPNVPAVEETGTTFAENAILKARAIGEYTGQLTLADDSGLEVDALHGEPGVYSARYGGAGKDDRGRYEYLLGKLSTVPQEQRAARFRSVVAVFDPSNKQLELGDGAVEGMIIDEPRGNSGFGYDPVFLLPEYNQTMSEISTEHKNELSHRARAVTALLPKLQKMLE